MANVFAFSSEFELCNIWDMIGFGLFFRVGPNRSYLSVSKFRSQVRGTEFEKYNDRVTIVLACNADGSHHMPVTYNGSPKNPRCFRSNRYD